MKRSSILRSTLAGTAMLALVLSACGSSDDGGDAGEEVTTTEAGASDTGFEGELVGTFTVTAAECADGAPTAGSSFRMVQSGGDVEAGPFVDNGDSICSDKSYTGLTPGTDGGLITGDYQAAPDPAFDADGNATAAAIVEPVPFFAVAFGVATDPEEATPTITATDGTLSGDLSAFTAYYGGGSFNQGAPKADSDAEGPTGTIDPETGEFSLDWTSLISGGSFDGFTGVWHLEGTFEPA